MQDHINFANSEAYRPFTADLAEIFDFAAAAPRFCEKLALLAYTVLTPKQIMSTLQVTAYPPEKHL